MTPSEYAAIECAAAKALWYVGENKFHPPTDRTVMIYEMHVGQGVKVRDIAKRLGIKRETVYQHILRYERN